MAQPRIGIIGAGVTGLAAAHQAQLVYGPAGATITIFESTAYVGGIWCNPASPIYAGLRTNLPYQLMQLEGLEYDPDEQRHTDCSYLTRAEVTAYLEAYVEKFELRPLVRLHHQIEKIERTQDSTWQVSGTANGSPFEAVVDILMICSGKYDVPRWPDDLKNQALFSGHHIHSKDFTSKTATCFNNKRVVVYGGAASGTDLMEELASTAAKVYFCQPRPAFVFGPKYPWAENVFRKGGIVDMGQDWVQFENEDVTTPVDTILYCTGYKKVIPFLPKNIGIDSVNDQAFTGLYKHAICIEEPSLAIMGLVDFNAAWPSVDIQAKHFLTLHKTKRLPSVQAMKKHNAAYIQDREKKGIPLRKLHASIYKGYMWWEEFMNDLCQEAQLTSLDAVLFDLFMANSLVILQHGLKKGREQYHLEIVEKHVVVQPFEWTLWAVFKVMRGVNLNAIITWAWWAKKMKARVYDAILEWFRLK